MGCDTTNFLCNLKPWLEALYFIAGGPVLAILAGFGLKQIKALKTQMQITRDIESRRLMFEISDSFEKWVDVQNVKWVSLNLPPRLTESLVRLKRDSVEVGYAEDFATYNDKEYAELHKLIDDMYLKLMAYTPQFFSLMNERGDELYHLFGTQFVLMANIIYAVKIPQWADTNDGKPLESSLLALHYTWSKRMGQTEKSVALFPKDGDAEVVRHVPEWTRSMPFDFDSAWAKGMSFSRSYD